MDPPNCVRPPLSSRYRDRVQGIEIADSPLLVQAPMLGYWLIAPVLFVLAERLHRLYLTFFAQYSAKLEALNDGITCITLEKAEGKTWGARAGQYVSFCISLFGSCLSGV